MSVALQVVQIIFQSVAIIFMICFMFIGIWSFIVFLKMAKNQRIQTYLLEKINKSISSFETSYKDIISSTKVVDSTEDISIDSDFPFEDFLDEENNIIKFDDNAK